jgi:hypothetical protein
MGAMSSEVRGESKTMIQNLGFIKNKDGIEGDKQVHFLGQNTQYR